MFKVGDKYKLVDPEGAMMNRTPEGTILEITGIDESEDGIVKGQHPDDADFISNLDISEGYVVKTTSVGELHMTLNATTPTDVCEILCSAIEQVWGNTGIRIEQLQIIWSDNGEDPYIKNIHIEGGG